MSWLLELLVDAIREMCSQFIVDMMELITNMFTELLSCNLSLFEELFSVVGSLYKNVIVPTGIAILLMILVWQLFKSMFGGKAGVNAEEPIELICRSAISLFLLAGSKPLVDYILRIAGTPYQWVVGTKVKVASFSGYVSTLEGVTDTLGISSLKFDHFYDNVEMDLLKALCLYVFEEYPQEQKTFPEAYKLLLNKSVEMLDSIFERLPTDHPAKGPYQLFSKAEKVKGNAVLGLGTRLQILQNKMVQQITSHTDIDLSLPGKQKCAYFCITSDQDSTYDMLATLFTSFLSIKLVRLADRTEERVLPVPVSFILDEFPNIGVVPDFKKKLATARSRRIGMSILFQNIPQLQNRYPDNQWEEILGGCDFSIFLGCNDMTTATYYSDRTGEITVSVASIRKNFFTIRATDYVPEYSESRSIGKRQLLLPDEILRYPLDQGILIIRGHNVLRFKKMDYTEHADAGKLKMEKVVDHIPNWYRKWEKQQQEFQILDEQVYEASAPLEKNESPIKENDVQEPLTVNGAVQKPKNKKRTGNGNTVMKVDDLFVKKSKG